MWRRCSQNGIHFNYLFNIYPAWLSPHPPAQSAVSVALALTAVSGCLRSSCGLPLEHEPPPSAPASDAPPGPGTREERRGLSGDQDYVILYFIINTTKLIIHATHPGLYGWDQLQPWRFLLIKILLMATQEIVLVLTVWIWWKGLTVLHSWCHVDKTLYPKDEQWAEVNTSMSWKKIEKYSFLLHYPVKL